MPLRKSQRAAKNGKRRIRKRRLFALLGVLGALSLASFTFGFVTAVASQIPELKPTAQDKRARDGFIYDRTGKSVLAVLRGRESRVLVEPKDIAPMMMHAIVAVEDKRFYEHRGVDLRAIGRAFWADVQNKAVVQGGSTITQQFIKNAYLKDQRSVARKLKEAALAWQLEQDWSKEEILAAYLNTIYFGNGAYGVEQAARTYFGKHASGLTIPEAALLAGIPPDPSRYDPVANPRAARERRRLVLDLMLRQGVISEEEYDDARSAALPAPEKIKLPGTEGPAGHYFVNYVKQQLIDHDDYGPGRVFGGGLRVTTTIDVELQEIARAAIAKTLKDPEGPQAALVAVNPHNGEILAMVGGSNFRESQFNLAVQGERQPGSAFKPFVLAAALEEGISPVTHFESKKIVISLGDRLWQVNNYEGSYLGSIDLETATVHSDNAVYAQLTQLVGPGNVVEMARDAGVRSPLNRYFAIGLGAEAANPLEMARAFSTFANGGHRVDGSILGDRPRAVIRINSKENQPLPRRVLSPNKTALLNSILQKVVTQGTGRRAALPDRPAAGKTGTTENYGDAWFVGYTPQLAVAVWVGYPKGLRPMLTEYHGEPVVGGTYPAEIWKTFMQTANAVRKFEPIGFDTPSVPYASARGVVFRDGRLQIDNGECHSVKQVFFFSGEEPQRTANCRENEVDVPQLVGMTVRQARARLISQPLTPGEYIFKPAKARQRLDVVIGQIPPSGRLSAYDEVKLVLPKPTHGVVPRVLGLEFEVAKVKLQRRNLSYEITEVDEGPAGHVLFQVPKPGVAARPGMLVKLAVGKVD